MTSCLACLTGVSAGFYDLPGSGFPAPWLCDPLPVAAYHQRIPNCWYHHHQPLPGLPLDCYLPLHLCRVFPLGCCHILHCSATSLDHQACLNQLHCPLRQTDHCISVRAAHALSGLTGSYVLCCHTHHALFPLCHETNSWLTRLVICQDKTWIGHSTRLHASFRTSDVMLQVKYLLGYNVPRANQLHKMLYSLVSGLHQLRWPELAMGLCWIALLLSIKRVAAHHRWCCSVAHLGQCLSNHLTPATHLHIVRCDDGVTLRCCCFCFYMHYCFASSHLTVQSM